MYEKCEIYKSAVAKGIQSMPIRSPEITFLMNEVHRCLNRMAVIASDKTKQTLSFYMKRFA